MNTPTRWDPMKDLNELTHRLFARAPLADRGHGHETLEVAQWAPLLNTFEFLLTDSPHPDPRPDLQRFFES